MTKTEERINDIVLNKVCQKPGITAQEIPVNQRGALLRLERMHKIEYVKDGWHLVDRPTIGGF
jgi:hypothetical protein